MGKKQPLPESQPEIDEHYMRLALRQARKAEAAGEVPVGALVVAHGPEDALVLGRGHNRPIGSNDPTAHAEVIALRAAARRVGNYRLSGATLYATVEPCAMCAGALVLARIDRIVYGCPDPKAGAVRSLYQIADDARLNHRMAVCGGVLAEDCAALLRAFFRQRRSRERQRP